MKRQSTQIKMIAEQEIPVKFETFMICSTTTQTLSGFYHTMNNIAFGDYQRENYWEEHMKYEFIESLLKGIVPPPIIVNIRDPEPYSQYIVDGGHRTRSILGFMNGDFGIKRGEEEIFYKKKGNTEVRLLDNYTKCFIDNKITVSIQMYRGLTQEGEHEIFQNINKMKCLSKGQCIKAIDTETSRILYNIYENTLYNAQKSITRRASSEWGYTWLETIVPVFLVRYCNKGDFTCSKETSMNLRSIGETYIDEARNYKRIVEDSIWICEKLLDTFYANIQKIMKSTLVPIMMLLTRNHGKEKILDTMSVLFQEQDTWDEWTTLQSVNPNSKRNVLKKVEMVERYIIEL